jgi:hypothetical protein
MNFVECVYGIWIELDRHISENQIYQIICAYTCACMYTYIHGKCLKFAPQSQQLCNRYSFPLLTFVCAGPLF